MAARRAFGKSAFTMWSKSGGHRGPRETIPGSWGSSALSPSRDLGHDSGTGKERAEEIVLKGVKSLGSTWGRAQELL